MGYASKGEQVVGKLEGENRQPHDVAVIKDSSTVFDMVSMEGTECT